MSRKTFSSQVGLIACVYALAAGIGCALCPSTPKPFSASLSLSGPWRVSGNGFSNHPITLPNTLADIKLGDKLTQPLYGSLTPAYQYVGAATYTRTISLPEDLAGKPLELTLGRVLWQSTATLDGQPLTVSPRASALNATSCDSFGTAHRFRVPALKAGIHTLSITIDNSRIHPITEKGHAYGDAMQTRWNGILGEITLKPVNPLDEIRSWAAQDGTLTLELPTERTFLNAPISLAAVKAAVLVEGLSIKQASLGPNNRLTISFAQAPSIWSCQSPTLYRVTLTTPSAQRTFKVGFRSFSRKGTKLYLNNTPLFVRANLDNCHFPLTGYPAMDKATWQRIMQAQKDQGINTLRFHSWCPPEVAFEVADELGILMSPEAGIWIDSWMSKQFPDVVGLGRGSLEVDTFVQRELHAIQQAYVDHASFFSLSIGNELGSSDFDQLNRWMGVCRTYDSSRLYSTSTARSVVPNDDYMVTHNYPGVGSVREWFTSHTDWDYERQYSRTAIPCIAHEIGQWPVYPDYAELKKYTGLLRPWNLQAFQTRDRQRNLLRFNRAYHTASLNTNRVIYKEEIESFMRTPSCQGIHLLGIQDYSGQGEALIGWLDSFYDAKRGAEQQVPIATVFADTVCLARFKSFAWRTSQTFRATLLVRNNGSQPIPAGTAYPVSFGDKTSSISLPQAIAPGELATVATYTHDLRDCVAPSQTALCFGNNRWDLWIYPATIDTLLSEDVLYTDDIDAMLKAAQAGRSVIFDASKLSIKNQSIRLSFRPVYWSTTWFPGQRNRTLGMVIDKTHPVFTHFPTDSWQNWNWYHLVEGARAICLNGDKWSNDTPIMMPVVDFHESQLAAALFEVKIGSGKVLISGLKLDSSRPEAQQLRKSMIAYLTSDTCKPSITLTPQEATQLLAQPSRKLTPRPARYQSAPVYIECAARRNATHRDLPWSKAIDRAELATGSYTLTGDNLRTWQDAKGRYWVGSTINLTLTKIPPIRGQLLIRFCDPDNGMRQAKGLFEGDPFTIPPHHQSGTYWLKMPIDMEDSLDGAINLTIHCTHGSNIMIDRVIALPQ